jgi:hypothetical protein
MKAIGQERDLSRTPRFDETPSIMLPETFSLAESASHSVPQAQLFGREQHQPPQGTHITEVIRASDRVGDVKPAIFGVRWATIHQKMINAVVSGGRVELNCCKNHDPEIMETPI